MPTLWAPHTTFESVRPGDAFPILIKFVPPSLSQENPNISPKTLIDSYVAELLRKGFPADKVKASKDALEVQLLEPFTTQDIISLTGTITGKDPQKRSVAYTIEVTTQDNRVVARGQGRVSF